MTVLKTLHITHQASELSLYSSDQQNLTKMKLLPVIITFLVSLSTVHCLAKASIELDDQDNDTEDQFLENFHLPDITDLAEKAKRAAALQKAEDLVKAENQGALDGNNTWTDALNEFSDLPVEEFEEQKTGLVESTEEFGRGLIMPTGKEVEERWRA